MRDPPRTDGGAEVHEPARDGAVVGRLFPLDLPGQRSIQGDQDLCFGHEDLLSTLHTVHLLEGGFVGAEDRSTALRHVTTTSAHEARPAQTLGTGRLLMRAYRSQTQSSPPACSRSP